MNIVLLQAASGSDIKGPTVRVPPGNYSIEKTGIFKEAKMFLNGNEGVYLNSRIILSNHTSIRVEASECENLTVRFIRE